MTEATSVVKTITSNLTGKRQTKAEAAVALRLSGCSYEEVARVLNYGDARSALNAVESVLSSTVDAESKERMRDIAQRRYEVLLLAVMGKATDETSAEQLPAQREARALIDRLVALHGLAMPQEFVLHTPTIQELEAWVAGTVAHKMPKVVEADIFGPRAIES